MSILMRDKQNGSFCVSVLNALREMPIKILVIIMPFILTACASKLESLDDGGLSTKQSNRADITATADSVVELNQDQVNFATDSELAQDNSLPKQELTAQTLEQLLTLNFASFNGDWKLASDNALSTAQATSDFRLARLATLFSLQTSDYDQAAQASTLWLSLKPDSVDAQNMNIISLVGAAKIEQAKEAIDKQMQGKLVDEQIKQVAALLVRQKNQEAGFEVVDSLVEKYSDSAQVHVSAAYVAEVFKQFEAAEYWANKALEIKPGWDLAAQMFARLLQTQNKNEERSAFIEQFVLQYPSSVAMRMSHASELVADKDYQQAYNLMQQVLQDAPNDVGALQFSAALANQLEEPKKAAYYYRQALDVEPDNDRVRMAAASLALSQKKLLTADRFYSEVSSLDDIFEAQIQLANVRYQRNGIDAAMTVLAMIEPQSNQEYLQMAITRHYLLMRDHMYEEAFGYTNDALVYLPNNTDLLYARALVASELKKVSIAEQDFLFIIAAEPENANALNALGYTLADQTERFEEAKKYIAKALQLRPNDAHILDSWGWLSYRLSDFETAIEYLNRAYESSPEVEIAAHLGEVLWESGDQAAAMEVWQKAFENENDNLVLNETLERYAVTLSENDNLVKDS